MRGIIYLAAVNCGLRLDQNFIETQFAILSFVIVIKQKKTETQLIVKIKLWLLVVINYDEKPFVLNRIEN